ncbi:MAG: hypothetical protein GQ574_17185 [Crocinitomix sp.]|nr:hypothetical protein [Crocinitomix sp.]
MNEDEIIDARPVSDFYGQNPRYKYATSIFALVDGVSVLTLFMLLYSNIMDGGFWLQFNFLTFFRILLVVSFAFSSVLFFLRKKEAFVLYYFQFPMRLLFMTMSFSFLIELFGGIYGTTAYWTVIVLVFALEVVRLVLTNLIHRKMNRFH